MTEKKALAYDESSITGFSGLEAVRKKFSMYGGELGDPAVCTQTKEAIDNALDEFFAGRNKTVQVGTYKGGYIVVHDGGLGVPVGMHKQFKMHTLEAIYTQLHTGGKFGGEGYKVSRGTHGIGVKLITAASDDFRVYTCRDGEWWTQAYARGKVLAKELKSGIGHEITKLTAKQLPAEAIAALPFPERVKKGGTLLVWKPDQTVVGKGAALDLGWLDTYLSDIAYLTRGFSASYKDAKGGVTEYVNTEGPTGWIKFMAERKGYELVFDPVVFESDSCDIVLQQTESIGAGVEGYTNNGWNSNGGTHVVGFWTAFAAVVGALSKGRSYDIKHLGYGMAGYVNWKMGEPQFSSQTKERLVSKVTDEAYELLYKPLMKALKAQPELLESIVSRAEARTSSMGATADMKALSKLVKASRNSKGLLPGSLVEATISPEELFVVEGASAGGHLKFARDRRYQEILELSGKILNTARTTTAKGILNKGINALLTAIGYDPAAAKFNPRVQRVYILTDADVDGDHITTLLLTMIWQYTPKMVEEGRIFLVNAPLFFAMSEDGKTSYMGKTLEELKSQIPKGQKVEVVRAKGWGEVEPEWVSVIAFNTATRKVTRVTPPTAVRGELVFDLMGKDSGPRKRLLGLANAADGADDE